MAAIDDSTVLGRSRLSFANEAEIDEFALTLARFEAGEIGPDQWRAYRLVRGTYGQRQAEDAQMLRVKIPQGILTQAQLYALADVADRYSRGFAHITTRQNVQFHFVKLHDVEPAMRRLAEAGLTTREACGNSVRNITACPYAGVAADEAFDVTPYAETLTRYFLRHPLSSVLPRKFKIAFEGCQEDHALPAIHDIGWRALVRDEEGRPVRGFRVTVGGGTATMVRSGFLLHDFLPVSAMLESAEAVVRVFHRLGDYKHKHKNRMKFLIKAIGWERFREEYQMALAEVAAEGPRPLPFDPENPPDEGPPDWVRPAPPAPAEIAGRVGSHTTHGPGIHPENRSSLTVLPEDRLLWQQRNLRPQRQRGFVTVIVSVPLGDLTAEQFRILGDLAVSYGDGTVRTTIEQDLVFRWIPIDAVPAMYERLAAAGLASAEAGTPTNVTSCPGAESCRLAVTQSRGLGRLLHEFLASRPDLADAAPGLSIKMSGCPNGCGQHHIANIGFQGSIRKLDGRAVPQYFVMVGGGPTADGNAAFGRVVAKIPARRAPAALERLIDFYRSSRQPGETPVAFFQRAEFDKVKTLLADLEPLSPEEATPEDFIDLGETKEFAPEVMEGECAS
ncbi:MAG TPA: nitrite/sulfite reductase [Vicinamibacterales bacterium]|nr:nitrite/sulfite reductase [Vicinamibacterales bacterium]